MIEDARLLYIDLEKKTTEVKTLDAETYRKYPGGSALGVYIILNEMDPTVDALSPENVLVCSVSPITGFPISGQSRMNMAAKSPITGGIGDSQVGGYIAPHIKGNGYDAVVLKNKADKPVYIYVDGDDVQIRDASGMWGMITGDAEKFIEEDLGHNKFESSIIGPAGENLIRYACVMHMRTRANGRTGMGAVMGSKNVKALVFKKTPMRKPVDKQDYKESFGNNMRERLDKVKNGISRVGTSCSVEKNGVIGYLSSYNWEKGCMNYQPINGLQLREEYMVKLGTCLGCGIHCKKEIEIPGYAVEEYGSPEFETLGTFGSYCGNEHMGYLCRANQLCNMYGLDTVAMGATIAWAMDCYEHGILTKEQTDGLELNFGRGDLFEPIIMKVVNREPGLGELLAKGSADAAAELGPEAEALAVTCKKAEWPAHMVQFKPSLSIVFAANAFGADHQSSEHDPSIMGPKDADAWKWVNMLETFEHVDEKCVLDDNKAKLAFVTQKYYSMLDTLCLCQFAWGLSWQVYGPPDVMNFCRCCIGWDVTIDELLAIGERRMNMMRMFNVANGFTREDDKLPKKAFRKIIDADGFEAQIHEEDWKKAMDTYYDLAGWDQETGVPKPETLQRLGLEWTEKFVPVQSNN